MNLEIRKVDPQGEDALRLLHEASIDAHALYPELFPGPFVAASNEPLWERGVYVLAYQDGQPVASGALRPYDASSAEVRRMYVHRDMRRVGLGQAVLTYLIDAARELGYLRLVLETGNRQDAAIKLYERNGFTRIAAFGPYVNDPTSVCLALDLSVAAK